MYYILKSHLNHLSNFYATFNLALTRFTGSLGLGVYKSILCEQPGHLIKITFYSLVDLVRLVHFHGSSTPLVIIRLLACI